jgi:hypothetical protein
VCSLGLCLPCCSSRAEFCALNQHYDRKQRHIAPAPTFHDFLVSLPDAGKAVQQFLFNLGLEQYTRLFLENGFETVRLLRTITPDMLDVLGLTKVGHRALLLNTVNNKTKM